jgi:multiple sugar transport system ATP-binding protein
MARVVLDHLTKVHPDGTVAVAGVDLTVGDGSFAAILGPSGSGKSTLVRMIAGLEEISDGDVLVDGVSIMNRATSGRRLGMVFQQCTNYPHMTVRENLAFPLRLAGWKRREIRRRVAEVSDLVGLGSMLDLHPAQLSGGMRQRASIGRALVRDPDLLLMDEPMSNLDAKVRTELRGQLAALHRRLRTTTIYVTHDQIEAMALADVVMVMRDGRIVQSGAPLDLYAHPVDMFVAAFVGSPPMTILAGRLELDAGRLAVVIGADRVTLGPADAWPLLATMAGRDLAVGIRPEAVVPRSDRMDRPDRGCLRVEFVRSEFVGSHRLVTADIAAHTVRDSGGGPSVDPMPRATLMAVLDDDVAVDLWRPVPVGLDPAGLHFFDLATGRSLPTGRRGDEVSHLVA